MWQDFIIMRNFQNVSVSWQFSYDGDMGTVWRAICNWYQSVKGFSPKNYLLNIKKFFQLKKVWNI